MNEFAYFMIRVRRPPDGAPRDALTGVIERLASGEKREFGGGGELLHLVAAWTEAGSKMESRPEGGNAGHEKSLTGRGEAQP